MTFEASSQTDLNWTLRFFDKKKITKVSKQHQTSGQLGNTELKKNLLKV